MDPRHWSTEDDPLHCPPAPGERRRGLLDAVLTVLFLVVVIACACGGWHLDRFLRP